MSASCEGVLMENLKACMHQGIATSPTAIEAPSNADLPMVEGFAMENTKIHHQKMWDFFFDKNLTPFPCSCPKHYSLLFRATPFFLIFLFSPIYVFYFILNFQN